MSGDFLKGIVLPVVVIVAGFSLVIFASGFIESSRPPLPDDYGDSDLTVNGSHARGFAFGMEGLIADWYYIRALQYVGEKILQSKSEVINIDDLTDLNPRLLYPLLDNATDLDPHFIDAFLYGAIVLPVIDPEKAVAIAEKGIANNPHEWRLYRPLGYIYWKLGQFEKASEIYERGSEIDGAPPFMKLMAAAMKTQGDSRETARAIYSEMLNNSADDAVRIIASRRLKELDSLDDIDAIDKVLADFKTANGRCPETLAEIMQMLMGVRFPGDRSFRVDSRNLVGAAGEPYILDRDKCKIQTAFLKTTNPAS